MKQMDYRRSATESDAIELQNIIHAAGIYCDLTQGAGEGKDCELVINRNDYIKVELLLSKHTLADINRLPPDYYLFAFSNEELIEIVHNPGNIAVKE